MKRKPVTALLSVLGIALAIAIVVLGSFLRDHGADTVSIASLDYVLDKQNPLYARLEAFLKR